MPPSRLDAYRSKRTDGSTPEPSGRAGEQRPGVFVVQKHAARSLHYDLRIEVGGVLKSWAVPKGPSFDPADKRFAVQTEDHPVEYADFEGIIPAGNYGAGAMIVWDRGLCVPVIEHQEGLEKGKLLFELRGYKLRGLWTLVKTKEKGQWLLIKERDGWAPDREVGEESIFSGLTVEQLRDGRSEAEEIRRELAEMGAARWREDPGRFSVMLAELRKEPFDRPDWLFELKYDGYRLVARKKEPEAASGTAPARLYLRSGIEATVSFPEIVRGLAALPCPDLRLDGEVVVLDEEARPSFARLQKRGRIQRPRDAQRAAIEMPVTYFAFDLLGFGEFDLRPLPLRRRKELLRRIVPRVGPVRFADHVEERGRAFFEAVRAMGLEGMMAKRADAPYRAGRSASWLKVRADRVAHFVIVGFTEPKGARTGFGALHLAEYRGERLSWVGRVGSGFRESDLVELRRRLEKEELEVAPVEGELPAGSEHHWVEARWVAEVRYTETTSTGQLRHPVFMGLREDLGLEECRRESEEASPAAPEFPSPTRSELRLTHRDKVFWPGEGISKGELLDYYEAVAPHLLRFLANRPLVLDRYPDGIDGKSFYQKNAPDHAPDWVRTETVWSEEGTSETEYFVCEDVEALLYLINLGTIPLHVWSSRCDRLHAPDWSILDLDAKEAPFEDVVTVARAVRRLCRRIELPCFAKTSGATGLHVLLPLGGQCSHEQSRQLAEILARLVAAELPEIATDQRSLQRRQGRVYIDALQNGYGKLLVAPFSVRPRPGGPVSTPLHWREVTRRLDPRDHTLRSVPKRLKRQKRDPLLPVLELRPNLPAALSRLAEML